MNQIFKAFKILILAFGIFNARSFFSTRWNSSVEIILAVSCHWSFWGMRLKTGLLCNIDIANCWKNEVTRNIIIFFLQKSRGPFPQELPRVLKRNFHKDRCADKISLIPADQNSDPKGDVIAALLRREKQFRIITQLNYVTVVTVYFSVCCYRRLHWIESCSLVLKCSYRFE